MKDGLRLYEPSQHQTNHNCVKLADLEDMTYRIVVGKHHGDISFFSKPGETRFQFRLLIAVRDELKERKIA
jgi:hypothetical protein